MIACPVPECPNRVASRKVWMCHTCLDRVPRLLRRRLYANAGALRSNPASKTCAKGFQRTLDEALIAAARELEGLGRCA